MHVATTTTITKPPPPHTHSSIFNSCISGLNLTLDLDVFWSKIFSRTEKSNCFPFILKEEEEKTNQSGKKNRLHWRSFIFVWWPFTVRVTITCFERADAQIRKTVSVHYSSSFCSSVSVCWHRMLLQKGLIWLTDTLMKGFWKNKSSRWQKLFKKKSKKAAALRMLRGADIFWKIFDLTSLEGRIRHTHTLHVIPLIMC